MQTPNSAPACLPGRRFKRRNHDITHGPGQHGAANHDGGCTLMVAQCRANLVAHATHELEFDVAVGAAGRSHADQRKVRLPDCGGHIRGRAQPPGCDLPSYDRTDVLLDDRRLAGIDQIDFPRFRIDSDNFMTFLG